MPIIASSRFFLFAHSKFFFIIYSGANDPLSDEDEEFEEEPVNEREPLPEGTTLAQLVVR